MEPRLVVVWLGLLRVDMLSSTIGKAPALILELGARLECWIICWRFNLVSHLSFIFRLVHECSLGELEVDRNDLDYSDYYGMKKQGISLQAAIESGKS